MGGSLPNQPPPSKQHLLNIPTAPEHVDLFVLTGSWGQPVLKARFPHNNKDPTLRSEAHWPCFQRAHMTLCYAADFPIAKAVLVSGVPARLSQFYRPWCLPNRRRVPLQLFVTAIAGLKLRGTHGHDNWYRSLNSTQHLPDKPERVNICRATGYTGGACGDGPAPVSPVSRPKTSCVSSSNLPCKRC